MWPPGAGGLCLHTIVLDPSNADRMFIAISAAGAFKTEDGGRTWRAINSGLKSDGIPNPDAEAGHCVHRLALHPSRPDVLFMQKHWDVMRSINAGESWEEVSGNLPTDFGFPIDVHTHEPETVYVVPIKSDSDHYPPDGRLRVYRSRTGGHEWEALTNGLPQQNCFVNVLRDAMAVDRLDLCGIYFGTTGGQVYVSPDGGDHWTTIAHNLPPVLSVEVLVEPVGQAGEQQPRSGLTVDVRVTPVRAGLEPFGHPRAQGADMRVRQELRLGHVVRLSLVVRRAILTPADLRTRKKRPQFIPREPRLAPMNHAVAIRADEPEVR